MTSYTMTLGYMADGPGRPPGRFVAGPPADAVTPDPEEERPMDLRCRLLTPTAKLPVRSSEWAAGLDLHSDEVVTVKPMSGRTIRTGLAMAIPEGYVGLICGRSGLAIGGISPRGGVLDQDYRGEVAVVLRNETEEPRHFGIGDRVAQLLLIPVGMHRPVAVDDLGETGRGSGGFGSTGA
jgi:dUTP pyrophosphatase